MIVLDQQSTINYHQPSNRIMAEKKESETPKATETSKTSKPKAPQIIKPVYPVDYYKGANVVFCKTCGDQLRTDLYGKVFCSQNKTKSQCPLLKAQS